MRKSQAYASIEKDWYGISLAVENDSSSSGLSGEFLQLKKSL